MLSPRFRCGVSGCSQLPRSLHQRNVVAQLAVAAFKRPTAEVLCSTSGSDIHTSSSIAWDQIRRPVPVPCRRLFPAPTGLNRVARIGIGLTDTGVCPSSRSRGVSRLRGHNIPLRGPRQAGAADGTDRAPGGGVRAGAYVSNRARMDYDCSASSRMAAIMGARLSGWVIRRSVPRSPRWPTVTGQSW